MLPYRFDEVRREWLARPPAPSSATTSYPRTSVTDGACVVGEAVGVDIGHKRQRPCPIYL